MTGEEARAELKSRWVEGQRDIVVSQELYTAYGDSLLAIERIRFSGDPIRDQYLVYKDAKVRRADL